jgi:hypothetical protein
MSLTATAVRSRSLISDEASRLMLRGTSMAGYRPRCAMSRDSTMWPSRIERTESEIGSFTSSPSTSTV